MREVVREHENEPVHGLPEDLPKGEGILWQGGPAWWPLARRALHLKGLAIYFLVLIAWRIASAMADGGTAADVVLAPLTLIGMAAACLGLLALIGRLQAGSAVYTVTNRRIVLRVGVALPMTVNLPFEAIQTAALRRHSDGTEDIILTLVPGHRASWVALWPHLRPWRLSRPEPMLRAVPVSSGAAQVIARALAASAGMPVGTLDAPAASGAAVPGAAVA